VGDLRVVSRLATVKHLDVFVRPQWLNCDIEKTSRVTLLPDPFGSPVAQIAVNQYTVNGCAENSTIAADGLATRYSSSHIRGKSSGYPNCTESCRRECQRKPYRYCRWLMSGKHRNSHRKIIQCSLNTSLRKMTQWG
jgi:hypothetical protein